MNDVCMSHFACMCCCFQWVTTSILHEVNVHVWSAWCSMKYRYTPRLCLNQWSESKWSVIELSVKKMRVLITDSWFCRIIVDFNALPVHYAEDTAVHRTHMHAQITICGEIWKYFTYFWKIIELLQMHTALVQYLNTVTCTICAIFRVYLATNPIDSIPNAQTIYRWSRLADSEQFLYLRMNVSIYGNEHTTLILSFMLRDGIFG